MQRLEESCPHTDIWLDESEGNEVCTQCGLVLQPIYLHPFSATTYKTEQTQTSSEEQMLIDIFFNNCLPYCYFDETFQLYKKISEKLLQKNNCLRNDEARCQSRISREEIIAFCIFHVMEQNGTPFTPQEVLRMLNIRAAATFDKPKQLKLFWRIENICSEFIETSTWSITDFVSRYAGYLCLSQKDINSLQKIIIPFDQFYAAEFNFRPQTIVSVVMYLYCKIMHTSTGEKMYKKSVREVCEVTNTCSPNIHKIIKKLNVEHVKDIRSILT